MTAAVEPFAHAGYDLDAAAVLLCESDGTPRKSPRRSNAWSTVLRAARRHAHPRSSRAKRSACASGPAARTPSLRPAASAPAYYCMDGTIPRKRLGEMLKAIQRAGNEVRAALPQRLPCRRRQPASADPVRCPTPDSVARAEAFGAEILELCVPMGGTVTGEHGVGVEKLDQMCSQFGRRRWMPFQRQARVRSGRPAQSGQGRSRRCIAAPSTAACASARHACLSRSCRASDGCPAVNPAVAADRVRVRATRAHARRCAFAAAAPRTSTAKPPTATLLDTRERGRHRRLRAHRTGRHRARRHAAGRAGGVARRTRPVLCRSSRRTSAPAHGRRHGRRRPRRVRARACGGSVRDFVLGVHAASTAAASCCASAATVMKNVAGYDVSRLMAGSLGTLGLIVEVSLKVLPRAAGRGDAALRVQADRSARAAPRLGRPAAAAECQRLGWNDGSRHRPAPARRGAPRSAEAACAASAASDAHDAAAPAGDACASTRDLLFVAADDASGRTRPVAPVGAADRAAAGACPRRRLIEWHGAQRWVATRPVGRGARSARQPRRAATPPCSRGRDRGATRRRFDAADAAVASASTAS